MLQSPRTRLVAAAAVAAGASLIVVPAASAEAVRYSVAPAQPGTPYTIKDNGSGLVKVTYDTCITEDAVNSLTFTSRTSVNRDSDAVYKLLQIKNPAPTLTFTPPTVPLKAGSEEVHSSTVNFSIADPTSASTLFRVKLDPVENGTGLGEAAGVRVEIPCVYAAATPPVVPPTTPPGEVPPVTPPATEEPPATPPAVITPSTVLAAPTVGVFPSVLGVQAVRQARCVSTPTSLRLRAKETSTVRVVIRSTSGRRLQGASVRFTYPGAVQVKRTNSNGVATARIRARRAGALVIQSDVCFGADRRRILPARVVRADNSARFTG